MASQNKSREHVSPVISQPAELGLALAVLLVTIAVVVGRVLMHITSISTVELGAVAAITGVYWLVWMAKALAPRSMSEQPASDGGAARQRRVDEHPRKLSVGSRQRPAA